MDENPFQSPAPPPPAPPKPDAGPYSFEKKLFWGVIYGLGLAIQQGIMFWLIFKFG